MVTARAKHKRARKIAKEHPEEYITAYKRRVPKEARVKKGKKGKSWDKTYRKFERELAEIGEKIPNMSDLNIREYTNKLSRAHGERMKKKWRILIRYYKFRQHGGTQFSKIQRPIRDIRQTWKVPGTEAEARKQAKERRKVMKRKVSVMRGQQVVGTQEAKKIQKRRSKKSKSMDARKTAKKVLTPTPKNVKRWKKYPGHYDIFGVDTKGLGLI